MKSFIFAINAISGGGKTTITKELQKYIKNSKALYFDDRNYDSDSGINDTCEWIENGCNVNLFELKRLTDDIDILIKENYDFIILDYPFGYRHKQVGPYLNYSIFIDTPLDIALARRILRDYNDNTINSIFEEMKHYLERGRNAYLYGLDSTKENADFIVDGTLSIEKIVECIYNRINEIKNKGKDK
jgi:uridine kinase